MSLKNKYKVTPALKPLCLMVNHNSFKFVLDCGISNTLARKYSYMLVYRGWLGLSRRLCINVADRFDVDLVVGVGYKFRFTTTKTLILRRVHTSDVNDAEILMTRQDFQFQKKKRVRAKPLGN